jgi:hypothetical protein
VPESACHDCERSINKDLEQPLTSEAFYGVRAHLGLVAPKALKDKTIFLTDRKTGLTRRQRISGADYPPILSMPVFRCLPMLCSVITNPGDEKRHGNVSLILGRGKLESLLDRFPDKRVSPAPIAGTVFLRFIAKVAHAGMVAMVGFDQFTPLLRDVIRADQDDAFSLIGSDDSRTPPDEENALHTIAFYEKWIKYDGSEYLVARVRLFSNVEDLDGGGTPTYLVVVGTRPQWRTREDAIAFWRTPPKSVWKKPLVLSSARVTNVDVEPGVRISTQNTATKHLADGLTWE